MVGFELEEWVASDKRIPREEWEQFRQQYCRDRGLNPEQWTKSPKHRVFAGRLSWLRLLPDDTVSRIQSADNLSSVLPDIIQQTIKNIENSGIDGDLSVPRLRGDDDDERTHVVEAALCNHIVGTLRGNIEVEKLNSETHKWSSGEFECPSGQISVTISSINTKQYTDYAIYTFDNAENVFGSMYGNSTRMLKTILERDSEPVAVVRDVAFVYQPNITWGVADPPNHSIAFYSMDGVNYSFYTVEEPQQRFSDTWGDIKMMNPTDVSEHISTVSVYFGISLGMCYD